MFSRSPIYFAIKQLSGFRLTTGRCNPSFFGTRKIWLINWSGRGLTFRIADFCSSSWILSAIILFSSVVSHIGLGGLPCRGSEINSKGYPIATCRIHGFEVIRSLVLLGSASHSISIERRKLVWAKMNPKLRSLGSEEYGARGTDLFGPGFLEKASKRLEVEKTLSKVTKPPPQNARRGRYESDKSDLRSFFIQGRFGSVREREESPTPSVHI